MKRLLVLSACVVGLWSGRAEAGSILIPLDSPTPLVASILSIGANPPVFDIQGLSAAIVDDSATPGVDSSGLTLGGGLPPNNNVVYLDAQGVSFTFLFPLGTFNGTLWDVPVIGSALVPPLTEPWLNNFVGADVAQLSFLSVAPIGDLAPVGFLAQYHLDFIASGDTAPVPEPATIALIGSGLVMAVRRRRR